MTESTNGITAPEEFVGKRLILKGGNYRVWNSRNTQHVKYLKLCKHVDGTAVRPPNARVVTATVRAVATSAGSDAIEAVAAFSQQMVDEDVKKIEEYDAAVARTTYMILQSLSEKDHLSVVSLTTPKEIWDKLAEDYESKSVAMAATARARSYGFKIRSGDTVLETQRIFEAAVNNCERQRVVLTEEEKALVLMCRPPEKWRVGFRIYANFDPQPSLGTIFKNMKVLEAVMNMDDERKYEEANYAGGYSGARGGGSGRPQWKKQMHPGR